MTKSISPEKLEKLLDHARQIVHQWDNYDKYKVCGDEPYGVAIARFMIESYEEIIGRK